MIPDDDDAVTAPLPTLGRRLDAMVRARLRDRRPRLPWAQPLAVAMHRTEELAGVLGSRFERTESVPAQAPELPPEVADALAGATHPPPEPPVGLDRAPDPERHEVPAHVRARLRREVGPAVDLMEVFTGPWSDALARAGDADAVTVGSRVHVRKDRWAPGREEGVALLAHEATHVAALADPGAAWRRSVGGAAETAAEERLAQARERSVLGHGPAAGPVRGTPDGALSPGSPAAAPAGPLPGATIAARAPARRAGTERDLTPAAPGPDLDALRREVIAQVMQRVRAETERGA